jgi:hypothetical protein
LASKIIPHFPAKPGACLAIALATAEAQRAYRLFQTVRVLKKERKKKFSRARLLPVDRAGLMGVRHQVSHAETFCLGVAKDKRMTRTHNTSSKRKKAKKCGA